MRITAGGRPQIVVLALLAVCSGLSLHAQAPPAKNPLLRLAQPWPEAEQMLQRKAEAEALRLFAREVPIALTLRGDSRENGEPHTIPVMLGARGHVRRMARTCEYVPIRMTLPEEQLKDTVFEGQDNLKLVVQCRNGGAFEQYLLREYLAYRVLNAITPRSFRARQVSVSYVDPAGKPIGTRHGMLLEDDGDVAKRMEGRIVELPRALFANLEQGTLDTMMMFEYMIGSTDFSIYALHNIVLVQTQDRTLYPVPYDFDMTGMVSPPYAIPDRRLPIGSVKERLYRGPCRTLEQIESILAPIRAKRDRVMALPDAIAELTTDSRDGAKSYLDAFYSSTREQKDVKRAFVDGCSKAPTM